MKIPEIKEDYANFVLNYAKKSGNGLYCLVKEMELNEDKTNLEADLQPDLIQAFAEEFPDVDLEELDTTVQWVIMISIAKQPKENEKP